MITLQAQTQTVQVDVHHVTRVEGHGNIVVDLHNGVLEQCELEIVEAPRFIEAILNGVNYSQAAQIASRICGICAVAHTTTSLRASEKALGVKLSPQTQLLRQIMMYAEILDSHILHTYMLVAPDFFGEGGAISLAKQIPEVVLRALRMKQVAGEICKTIAGRHTHPIAMVVGGFTHFPTKNELATLRERLLAMHPDMDETVNLFQGLAFPDFERETEFIALHQAETYNFIDGDLISSEGGIWPAEAYRQITNEHVVSHSTAKHAHHQRESYMVGALARFNLNYDLLEPQAKAAARALNLSPGCTNPYKITLAQVIEMVHCLEAAIRVLDQLLENGITPEPPATPASLSGSGVGACEAPRGTLFHHYEIKGGFITTANCVIPTAQNLANIEADMRALVPQIALQPADEITLALEMLVRAYDPCISCATHHLKVKFS
jgi:sulfhydrogenase subunit alpha